MSALLVPVDPGFPRHTQQALDRAIDLCRTGGHQVHLLSVQPPVSSHVGMFFADTELRGLHNDCGAEELAPACDRLSRAGIACDSHVRVGRRAETIARVARELDCDAVVMGTDEPEGLARRLFGSVAHQVRHLLGSAGRIQVLGT